MNLLHTAHELERYSLLTVDGEIGTVEDFYFDDTTWTVRYLVVNAGGRATDSRVLISPVAIGEIDEEKGTINIELTRSQIENSPPLRADRSVSRQFEMEYYQYYDWTPYWVLDSLAGFPITGTPQASPPITGTEATHLRRASEVNGFAIAALDGESGRVEDFIIDTQYWIIRYLEIDTRSGWSGKHVLINPGGIEEVSWAKRAVSVSLSCEVIEGALDFDPAKIIGREYEIQLFKYYGYAGYWQLGDEKH